MVDSHELSARQCETLLRAEVVGRVAVSTPTGPQIIPVNYTVVDDAIIIRTTPYSVLGTHGRDTTLAFEIDGFDRPRERGWSVQARGRAEVVTDSDELAHIRAVADRPPWASGTRSMCMRLRWNDLSGRQLGRLWDPIELAQPTPGGGTGRGQTSQGRLPLP
jgi:nitroimidazol reductase NimA-like FMN-containing flavoprotein (pyridoxamine 5'-phosphate oxidase superfamily)